MPEKTNIPYVALPYEPPATITTQPALDDSSCAQNQSEPRRSEVKRNDFLLQLLVECLIGPLVEAALPALFSCGD
ncbi:hypothetical protein CAEBREN_21475 [Caenorhabditis brenneri]|uniref:Uncharacterized protein n=1 Tax=Caenorhabditis brenneri TaxID=135651 RepID=G0M9Z7_CAEBE|nr:hypothetical protein CAEBREN_21475 [Caenorhabditis brenneri]